MENSNQKKTNEEKLYQAKGQIPEYLQHLLHTCTRDHLSNPHPRLGEVVTVRLEFPSDGKPEQVVLRTIPNGEQQLSALKKVAETDSKQVWEGQLKINEPKVPYRFAIQDEGRIWWYNAAGLHKYVPLGLFDFKLLADVPEIPWLQSSVFYQIFPDRFANGNPSNDPIDEELDIYPGVTRSTYPWGERADKSKSRMHFPFYGGDLVGIEQKLPYLQDLGVNALYLNPIFTAFTDHRYDVADFRNVDPVLGGNDALISLSKALKAKNMRYILDIVPNHCGAGHPWFREAYKDPESPKRGAFYFDEQNNYASWMGFGSLPKLNYRNAELREKMFGSETSVFAHWLKPPYHADGWRVDVGNMLGRHDADQLDGEVLPAIRRAVKGASAESYLIGENFFEAIGQLQGDIWDGVMNYAGFSDPFLHWLKPYRHSALRCEEVLESSLPDDTDSLIQSWETNLAAIPYALALQQFNLHGSHDTARIATILEGDQALIKLAAMVQFAFPGVPCVYYGDEIGLRNEEAFAQRNCFPWDESRWDQNLRAFYQRLIGLRRSSQILAYGSFRVLYWDEFGFVFERALAGERILLSANREARPHEVLIDFARLDGERDHAFEGFFSGERLEVRAGQLWLPAQDKGAEIWIE